MLEINKTSSWLLAHTLTLALALADLMRSKSKRKSMSKTFHAKWYPEGMGDSWKDPTLSLRQTQEELLPRSCLGQHGF